MSSSRIPGFYKKTLDDRLEALQQSTGLSDEDLAVLRGNDPEALARAEHMIENVVGLFHLPVGFATNFRVDDEDVLVPMVIEEPSVVAAASKAARLLRTGKGIVTSATPPIMIGQIQLCDVPDPRAARDAIEAEAARLIAAANATQPRLVARGGGARAIEVRRVQDMYQATDFLVVHLHVDVRDAMGANLVNQMCETLAPRVADLSGGWVNLRILSNLADERRVAAVGRVPVALLARPDLGMDGSEVAERLVSASQFAEADPYRATTHNKGILNGMDAVMLATGQDWRALEAGAHAFAARTGRYRALATWRYDAGRRELVGHMDVPVQVGTVGGVTQVHPVVKVLLRSLGQPDATTLARLSGAVGLAQNLAAILALTTEGIQRGHMSLHARNLAVAAGARQDQIDAVVARMIADGTFSQNAAEGILASWEAEESARPMTA